MKFNSVKEYFYKLNATGYQLMTVPLIPFILFYAQSIIDLSWLIFFNEAISIILFLGLCSFGIITLTVVQIITIRKAKAIAREVGLGIKLEKIGVVLTRKMVVLATLVTLMPAALILTGNSYFSLAYIVTAVWFFLQWPTPARVCRLLQLRGDEQEMVISRGEAFK